MNPKIVDSIDFWPHCDVCNSTLGVETEADWTRDLNGEKVPVMLCATCRKNFGACMEKFKREP